ncbi:PAS domain S-box protein [Bacillus sp. DJP31]|uniref:PAS domain S-box protein n=1 Tax=Bacillus sp. DJP31 TaxID=3409789 RepID=UPI003BB63F9C
MNPNNTFQENTESELEIIWNNTNDAIFLIASDGAISKANPSFERMLGYSAEDKGQSSPSNYP